MNFALKSLRTRAVLASSKERCVVPCASRANASSFVDSATGLLSSAEPLLGNAIALVSAVGAAAYGFRSILREANADRAKEFGILTAMLRENVKNDLKSTTAIIEGDLKSATEKVDIKMAALKELVAKEVDAKIAGVSDKAKAEALMVLKDYGVSTSFLFRACRRRATCLTCSFSIPLARSLSRVARQAFRARHSSTLEGTEGARGA